MPSVPFPKKALTLREQVELLRSRGMTVADEALAEHYLGFINYYRLAAYCLPFEADHTTHTFQSGTTFERVLDHYVFDRNLRVLLIDAIERVEVAVRTQFAYQLAHAYGPHALLEARLFRGKGSRWSYREDRQKLEREVRDSRETFVQHLREKYAESLPPIWAAVEIMTLGQLSKWYANLARSGDRNLVARVFDFDETNLASFLHHLVIVRNLCAHHSRVWNRQFTFSLKIPRQRPVAVRSSLNPAAQRKLYNTLVILAFFLDTVSPGHHWKRRLQDLLQDHSVCEAEMGFPADWRTRAIWK